MKWKGIYAMIWNTVMASEWWQLNIEYFFILVVEYQCQNNFTTKNQTKIKNENHTRMKKEKWWFTKIHETFLVINTIMISTSRVKISMGNQISREAYLFQTFVIYLSYTWTISKTI